MLSEVTGVFISTSAAAGPTSLCVYLCLLMAIFRTEANFFSAAVLGGLGWAWPRVAIICYALLKSEKNKQGPIISFLCSLLAMDMCDQLTIGQSHLVGKGSLNFPFQKKSAIGKDFHLNY